MQIHTYTNNVLSNVMVGSNKYTGQVKQVGRKRIFSLRESNLELLKVPWREVKLNVCFI